MLTCTSNKFTLALVATLLMGIMSACQIDDDDGVPSGNSGGNGGQVVSCTEDKQCPSSAWTQGFCNVNTCDQYATNCGGIKTRRIGGNTAPLEAYGGWGGQQPAPNLGRVPVTTDYTNVPLAGTCAVHSSVPFDCNIEYAGGVRMVTKQYHGVTTCSFDGLHNVPDDPTL